MVSFPITSQVIFSDVEFAVSDSCILTSLDYLPSSWRSLSTLPSSALGCESFPMTPLLHACSGQATRMTLLKCSQTHSVPRLSPPPPSAQREQAAHGPQALVCPTSTCLCFQCWTFSVCSTGPTAHCVSPDPCAQEPTFTAVMHGAPCPRVPVVVREGVDSRGGRGGARGATLPVLPPFSLRAGGSSSRR